MTPPRCPGPPAPAGRPPRPRGLSPAGLLLLGLLALAPGLGARERWQNPFVGEKWGPFRGQVVDAETGQPIPGAVVLVVWWKAVFTPVQTNQEFYDAREVLTDADGRFEVPRYPPPFFTMQFFRPDVIIFAAGYIREKTVVTPPDGQRFVAPTVVHMRRLKTQEERLRNLDRYPPSIPARKMPLLLQAVNRERATVGLGPIRRGVPEDPE